MIHKSIYMKRIILGSSLLLCALFTAPAMHAQESVEVLIHENGTERQESIELPKSMTYPLDSLLNDWKAKNYIDLGKDCSTSTLNPTFSDSVYIDRLSRMPTVMEMPYNEIVRKFIDMYAGRLRNQVSFMLSACNFYMPIFEEALDAYGLPLELKYLPHHRVCPQPFCRIPRGSLRPMAVYARHRKDIRTGEQQPRRRAPRPDKGNLGSSTLSEGHV